MKRSREKKITEEVIPLPPEILGEIAKCYTPVCVGDIFKFCLVSKTALLVSHLCLPKWIDLLCLYANPNYRNKDGHRYIKMKKEAEILMAYHNTNIRMLRVAWEKQKQRPDGPSKEYLNACFDLMKLAIINNRLKVTSSVEHKQDINASTKLSDLFYYDEEKGSVIPMKRIEGLRIVEMPRPTVMILEIEKIIHENTIPHITEMALVGLNNLKPPFIRAAYYHLCNSTSNPIKTHKPHKKSLVYNTIINNNHIFSGKDNTKIRGRLYSCLSVERQSITRENIVLLFATEYKKYQKLCGILSI